MITHLTEDELVLHYYGETDSATEAAASTHLAACRDCHASYTRLKRVLAAVEAAPGPEIADGFERTVWARLEPKLGPDQGWLSWLVFSPARLAWGAAVVALVAGSFFAGRQWQRAVPTPVPGPVPAATAASASPSQIRERILLIDLGDHLERSQMMLVELVSADDGTVDVSAERTRAEQLVAANRLYRQTATATGDRSVAAVLDELERVLVDVAAGPDELTATDLDDVRQRIDAHGLLFKVRVAASQIRERQKNESRGRAGQSS
jgi:hypothetical protein